ncbi:Putative transmembrane anti-sigma factor [Planctomycetales bacterium 10988]|nr:Putative transmembrane anti-sigma factor [Planctomycetales bacterium 10988]
MSDKQFADTGPLFSSEDLVAYLDGELPADQQALLEQQLSYDPAMRRELQSLESVWDMLDVLPRTEVDERFTTTTIEMVSHKVDESLTTAFEELPTKRRRTWLMLLGASLLMAVFGYAFGRWLWSDPNDELLRDLPVLQRMDSYRKIETLPALKTLAESGVFDEKTNESPKE